MIDTIRREEAGDAFVELIEHGRAMLEIEVDVYHEIHGNIPP